MRTLPFCTFALAAIISAAGARADDRAAIQRELSGFEHQPTTDAVRAWGAPGAQSLMDIARDASVIEAVRSRAVYALRVFPTLANVHPFLRDIASDASTPTSVRRSAFDALAEGFGDVTEVARYLHVPDVALRDGAAWTLSRLRTPSAVAALRSALTSETDPAVRATMSRAVH